MTQSFNVRSFCLTGLLFFNDFLMKCKEQVLLVIDNLKSVETKQITQCFYWILFC